MKEMTEMKREIPTQMNINRIPPQMKKEILPYAVVKFMTGARVAPNYQNKPDVVCLQWNDSEELLQKDDFLLVKEVANRIWKELIEGKGLLTSINTIPVALQIHQRAAEIIGRQSDETCRDKRNVLFVSDKSGCGYWRMITPARYIDAEKFYIDVASVKVIYDILLAYDTIVVQRLYGWDEFYVLEKLKRLGKKIVYEIDDDLFNIPPNNPAYEVIRDDQQQAAMAIIGLCDMITTPSEVLKERLGFPEKTVVLPNAIDLDDGWRIIQKGEDAKKFAYVNEWRRLFWQGSHTHADDWNVCIEAVDRIMQKNDDLHLVIMGFLPPVVQECVQDPNKPWWNYRVEFQQFENLETYVRLLKQFRAEVAIAPLKNTKFNHAKSPIKYVEYTAAGVPTIASNVTPYKEAISDSQNGLLVENTPEAWEEAIQALLDNASYRMELIRGARKNVEQNFNIKRVAKEWEKILL